MNYKDILPNWMNYEKVYSDAVKEADPSIPHQFLELGTFLGRSAAFMSQEIKSSGKQIQLHTVDIFSGNDEKFADQSIGMYKTTIQNLAECGADDVIIHKSTTDQYFSSLEKQPTFQFIFIDASHDYNQVKKDIQNSLLVLKSGGTMAGHDYNLPGVKEAVDCYFGFHELSFYENCWIYRKD